MTASTLPTSERATDNSTEATSGRPGLGRLTGVEMRKMIDTRAGFWLLVVIALGCLAGIGIQLIWGDGSDNRMSRFFEVSLFPVGLLLPVLGILTVTSEWTQRTALSTFTLVPQRSRILIAKLAAAICFAALSLVTSLLLSAVANLLTVVLNRGDGSWSLSASKLGEALVYQVLSVVMGVAFGMLLLNSAVAIVLYFILPTVWGALSAAINAIQSAAAWLDVNGAMNPLTSGNATGKDWGQLATASLLWIALPLLLGWQRMLRSELK